jgi:hypothetical protein
MGVRCPICSQDIQLQAQQGREIICGSCNRRFPRSALSVELPLPPSPSAPALSSKSEELLLQTRDLEPSEALGALLASSPPPKAGIELSRMFEQPLPDAPTDRLERLDDDDLEPMTSSLSAMDAKHSLAFEREVFGLAPDSSPALRAPTAEEPRPYRRSALSRALPTSAAPGRALAAEPKPDLDPQDARRPPRAVGAAAKGARSIPEGATARASLNELREAADELPARRMFESAVGVAHAPPPDPLPHASNAPAARAPGFGAPAEQERYFEVGGRPVEANTGARLRRRWAMQSFLGLLLFGSFCAGLYLLWDSVDHPFKAKVQTAAQDFSDALPGGPPPGTRPAAPRPSGEAAPPEGELKSTTVWQELTGEARERGHYIERTETRPDGKKVKVWVPRDNPQPTPVKR